MRHRLAPFLTLAALFGPSTFALAHEGDEDHEHPPIAVQPAAVYEPTALPDRIILTWSDDPTSTQSVTWRTSTDVRRAFAEIAVATAGPEFPRHAVRIDATSEALMTNINTAHFHSVTFRDLAAGTRYCYRVGDGINWSEWFQFSTASDEPEAFSFVYFGDAQNDVRSMWSRVIRESMRDAPKAKFLLHAGDLINKAEQDEEWGEWHGAGGWLNAMIPNLAVPGNHEQAKAENGGNRLSRHWRPQFTLPQNGIAGLEETSYTLTYQNLRIIALDSNRMHAEQAEWLDQVLSENEHPWVICTFHHPIYSTGKDRDNDKLRKLWKPIFDKHFVDLVLQGHDHTYGRTGLDTPLETVGNVPVGATNVDTRTGTVYVVSVSGPKMYDLQPHPFMRRMGADTQLYQVIQIDGDRLTYESRTANGELFDAFELVKRAGTINELIERSPEQAATAVPRRRSRPRADQSLGPRRSQRSGRRLIAARSFPPHLATRPRWPATALSPPFAAS
ncbi:MAG: metallophosphoesterase family protein [Planctomycetaceae bacterium]